MMVRLHNLTLTIISLNLKNWKRKNAVFLKLKEKLAIDQWSYQVSCIIASFFTHYSQSCNTATVFSKNMFTDESCHSVGNWVMFFWTL